MKWVIVVAFLVQPGEKGQDIWAFAGYPFPDVVTCKAFAGMNYDLAVNIAVENIERPREDVQDVYCAPLRELLEMKNGQSI